jgi:hypothetical protein
MISALPFGVGSYDEDRPLMRVIRREGIAL